MKSFKIACFSLSIIALSLLSCNGNNNSKNESDSDAMSTTDSTVITELAVDYSAGDQTFKSYAAYKEGGENLPVVLVVPEWWGVNDYTRSRVKQLAELGYFAMAVDMYGDGKTANDPATAGELATPFYKDAQLARKHFEAALEKAKSFNQVDSSKIAAIGYCFGGSMVLNMARLGLDLKGVVSFHGGLNGGLPPAQKGSIKAALLVLHGEADSMVPEEEVKAFKKEMDEAEVNYKFIGYPGAKHAFTNPNATAVGQKHNIDVAYDETADKASWEELVSFLSSVFQY